MDLGLAYLKMDEIAALGCGRAITGPARGSGADQPSLLKVGSFVENTWCRGGMRSLGWGTTLEYLSGAGMSPLCSYY